MLEAAIKRLTAILTKRRNSYTKDQDALVTVRMVSLASKAHYEM